MKYKVTNIEYEISEDDVFAEDGLGSTVEEVQANLPNELVFEVMDNNPDQLADMISDETGWLVQSFDAELIQVADPISLETGERIEIQWDDTVEQHQTAEAATEAILNGFAESGSPPLYVWVVDQNGDQVRALGCEWNATLIDA